MNRTRATVSAEIVLRDLPIRSIERLRFALSYPHPEYVQAIRLNRSTAGLPIRFECMTEWPDGSISVPRGAVDVVREFWKLAGEGRLGEAKRFLVAADSPIRQWTGGDIAGARFVRVVPHSVARAPKATVEFSAIVWIRPSAGVTPWGETGTHQLFENVMRMSDGTWRMYESGTGP